MLLKRLLRRAAAILIVCLFGTNLSYAGAQPTTTSVLAGWVYIDQNNDGDLTFAPDPNAEFMISGVTISLYSQENGSETFIRSDITDEFGRFEFGGLLAGTYGLKQTQPIQYVDGKQNVGEIFSRTGGPPPAGSFVGTMDDFENEFNGIDLPSGSHGDYYLFGEVGLASGFVSKRFLSGYPPLMEFGTDEPGFIIPEPATMWLAAAAVGMGLIPRRRRRSVAQG
jgi:hypothetical protein